MGIGGLAKLSTDSVPLLPSGGQVTINFVLVRRLDRYPTAQLELGQLFVLVESSAHDEWSALMLGPEALNLL